MKNLQKITKTSMILLAFVATLFSCKKEDEATTSGGSIPTAGWRIGTTNYTRVFSMRNAGFANSIAYFDALPNANNLNSVIVLFNNITGIAAGTFKVVFKPNQSDLLANEILVQTATGYMQATGQYNKQYLTVIGETVDATVTITGGKAKIVIPQINIISYPINSSSVSTNFAGTIIEQ